MKNKELIENLVAYLMEQDKATLCRALANDMLDFHRIQNLLQMEDGERLRLFQRIRHNSEELMRFAKEGPIGPFVLKDVSHDH
jgi:hypothetical protein